MALTDKIVLNSLSEVRNVEDSFIKLLSSTIKKLETNLLAQINASPEGVVIDTALARQQVETLLIESGYYEATGQLLSEGYQKAIDEAHKVYLKSTGENFQYSELSLNRLNSIKNVDFETMSKIASDFANDYTGIILDVNFGSMSKAQAIKTLMEKATGFERFASTWVTTGLSKTYRESSTLLAQDHGFTKFKYVGPLDNATRKFCSHTLTANGGEYTIEQINAMDNGQINPVMNYGGGYNCRHQWVGVE